MNPINKRILTAIAAGVMLTAFARERMELADWKLADADVIRKQAMESGWLVEDNFWPYLEGRQLSQPGFDCSGWQSAVVPGTVLTSLVKNGVYPEPCYGSNNRPEVIPESLCRHDWWYRTEVKIPESFRGRRVWLEFDGINYAAEIHVNGRFAGRMKGAFKRGAFDITDCRIKYGEMNAIAVRVSPQPTVGVPNEHTMGTHGGPCGGVCRYDGPTFSCSVGWDWQGGVRDRNTGLWRRVYISSTGPAVLLDPYIVTDLPDLPDLSRATIAVDVPVRNLRDRPIKGTLSIEFEGAKISREMEIPAYATQTAHFDAKSDPAAFDVKNPKLWWPNGLGEPALHKMAFSFAFENKPSDAREATFGIRKFSYFTPGKKQFELSVNGTPVFMKGGNWGLDEFLKRIDRDRIDAQVRYHRDCNYNMIRNWGGQNYSDELADACDKYGILLWQEFWHMDSSGPRDVDLYLANLRDTVLRYRNRASIPFWCALNEATPPDFLNEEIRRTLLELDPERHYQPNSGSFFGFNSGGPYEWMPPVKYSRYFEDPNYNKNETFKTELGAVAIPTVESIETMFPAAGLESINDDWGECNITAASGRSYLRYMKSRYGEPANFADFVRKAQVMNYEAHRAMYEGRLARMFEPAEGVLLWMSIPSHPSFIWNIVSYDLEPHAAFYAIQAACRPRHAFFTETDGGTLHAVNHTREPMKGKARVCFLAPDGSLKGESQYDIDVPAATAAKIAKIEWPADLPKVHFLRISYAGADGKDAEDNFYWRRTDTNPENVKDLGDTNRLIYREDLKELCAMPAVTLKAAARVAAKSDPGRTVVEVALKNPSPNLAFLVHVQLRDGKGGKRVLPAFCDDNYVTIAGGERKIVRIECDAAALDGKEPAVYVDGWNVKVEEVAGSRVYNNLDADPASPRWAKQQGFGFKLPEMEAQDVVRINCGGYNRGNFAKDPGFLDGFSGYVIEAVDLSGAKNPAPADVYRTVRWSNSEYICRMTGKNRPYLLRLHFCESSKDKAKEGCRFDVKVNGKVVLPDFDVAAAAGGVNKALSVDVPGISSDADGKIVIRFEQGKNTGVEKHRDPRVCGFEVLPVK